MHGQGFFSSGRGTSAKLALCLALLLTLQPWLGPRVFGKTESKPTAIVASDTQPNFYLETAKLIQIYSKIQRLAGTKDLRGMNEVLTLLDKTLDEIIAFQESWTPEKKQKIKNHLGAIKKEASQMADVERLELKSHAISLSEKLLKLVQDLADTKSN